MMKKLVLASILIFSLGLAGCSSAEEVSSISEEPVQEEAAQVDEERVSNAQQRVLSILQNRFKRYADIRYAESGKTYVLRIVDSSTLDEISLILSGEMSVSSWDLLTDELVDVSRTVYEELGEGYSIQIENSYDSSKTWVLILDGELLYDAIHDNASF